MTNLQKKRYSATEQEAAAALAEMAAQELYEVEQVREKSPPIDAANLEQIADFPIDVLPESIAEHITLASEMHIAPADFLAIGYLATLATFTGGLYEIKSDLTSIGDDGGQQYGNLYFILIGDSSDGKTKALTEFMQPAKAIDRNMKEKYKTAASQYRKDLRQYRADVKKNPNAGEPIAPDLVMYYINKCTTAGLLAQVERNSKSGKPLCLHVDELKGLFDKINKGGGHLTDLVSVLIDLFQQSPITEIRKGSSQDGQSIDNITDIVHSALTFVGGIQKRSIKTLINELTIAQGFAPRLAYTSSKCDDRPYKMPEAEQIKRLKEYRAKWAASINELHHQYEKNVHLAQAGQKCRKTFYLDDTSIDFHVAFEIQHVEKMNAYRKANEPELREMIAKHREIILRFALVLHVGDHYAKAPELAALHPIKAKIPAATFERACRLQQYFEQQTLKALDKDVNVHPRELLPLNVQQWYEALPSTFKRNDLLTETAKEKHAKYHINTTRTMDYYLAKLKQAQALAADRTGMYTKI
jgi:hypothetical protein